MKNSWNISFTVIMVLIVIVMNSCMSGSDDFSNASVSLHGTYSEDPENDTMFRIMDNTGITAVIENGDGDGIADHQLWHIDWLDSEGELVYRKRVEFDAEDTVSEVKSYISSSPASRMPGRYCVEFYYFRERVATKYFTLQPAFDLTDHRGELETEIALYRGVSRKTGKRVGEGTEFTLRKKRKVRALIEIDNNLENINGDLFFKVRWIGPDGKSVYSKEFHEPVTEKQIILKSYISIEPGSRQPGDYRVEVFLFGVKIGEQEFVVKP